MEAHFQSFLLNVVFTPSWIRWLLWTHSDMFLTRFKVNSSFSSNLKLWAETIQNASLTETQLTISFAFPLNREMLKQLWQWQFSETAKEICCLNLLPILLTYTTASMWWGPITEGVNVTFDLFKFCIKWDKMIIKHKQMPPIASHQKTRNLVVSENK